MAPDEQARALEEAVSQLFAGPPAGFIAARDALVKQLREGGETQAAAEVKALRRPTTAAWAVNQLAHRDAEGLAELLALGERLRDAHQAMLEGKGAESLREAVATRRQLTAALAERAMTFLGPAGEGQRDAITHTLDAAVSDPEHAEALRRGRLSKELPAPAGFGGLESLDWGEPPRAPTPAQGPSDRPPARPAPDTPPPADQSVGLERLRRLAAERKAAIAEAEAAGEEAAAARREVRRLKDLLHAAEARSTNAERRSRAAQSAAAEAMEALRSAEQGPQTGSRS